MGTATGRDIGGALEKLTEQECLELLRSSVVGRVAVGRTDEAPLVLPVNYAMDGDVVVFRTDAGTKLEALQHRPATFEVDSFDPANHTGWSVEVVGVAFEATHWEVQHVDVSSWIEGKKGHWIRIRPTLITGRRVRTSAS